MLFQCHLIQLHCILTHQLLCAAGRSAFPKGFWANHSGSHLFVTCSAWVASFKMQSVSELRVSRHKIRAVLSGKWLSG